MLALTSSTIQCKILSNIFKFNDQIIPIFPFLHSFHSQQSNLPFHLMISFSLFIPFHFLFHSISFSWFHLALSFLFTPIQLYALTFFYSYLYFLGFLSFFLFKQYLGTYYNPLSQLVISSAYNFFLLSSLLALNANNFITFFFTIEFSSLSLIGLIFLSEHTIMIVCKETLAAQIKFFQYVMSQSSLAFY